MKIEPYTDRPEVPRVAWLDGAGECWLEGGTTCDPDELPEGFRLWTCYEVAVNELLADGRGEALCWNNEPIRWRPSAATGWRDRATAIVLRLPFPDEPALCVRALEAWRDWLDSSGAAPIGTLGSSAWSLLRASLRRPLWTNVGDVPPIGFTLGGRQHVGPAGPGLFDGSFVHVDMPAAYASTLGGMKYGGRWRRLPGSFRFDVGAIGGHLIFCRAKVSVPARLVEGPLPRRPRLRPAAPVIFDTVTYPTGVRLQGVWSWEELEAARDHGCKVDVLEGWMHIPEEWRPRPFALWWEMVQVGRQMPDTAGLLAKATGNALWGQFCITDGVRSVHTYTAAGRLTRVEIPSHGSRPGSPDLAEQVTGRVRARLWRMMQAAGDDLVSCHTDGGWVRGPFEYPGWREKDQAVSIELLNPQMLAYTRPEGGRKIVCAGVPARFAERVFSQAWDNANLEERAA